MNRIVHFGDKGPSVEEWYKYMKVQALQHRFPELVQRIIKATGNEALHKTISQDIPKMSKFKPPAQDGYRYHPDQLQN